MPNMAYGIRRIVLTSILVLGLVPFCPAAIQVDSFSRPTTESNAPTCWFKSSDIPTLTNRITNPFYSSYYGTFKSYVDTQLAGIGSSTNDDTLSKFAKAAAFLHQLGKTPSSGPYATYASAATQALCRIGSRTPWTNPLSPPADKPNILQDCGRLQSMAEAYDMLRGTSELPGANAAIRARIKQWANALQNDLNMTGYVPLSIKGHTNDNWGIKAGSALMTCGLIMAADGDAATWFNKGLAWINRSLLEKSTDGGWHKESSHYVNYSLNNLVSAAWQVKNMAGIDWFDDLKPYCEYAIRSRQPNGQFAPFEEGISMVFPFDVLARAYSDIGPYMLWAWQNSTRYGDNYLVQQIPEVHQFIVNDGERAAVQPPYSPSQFLTNQANTIVLREDWTSSSIQATVFCAPDYVGYGTNSDRHASQNTLDLTISGFGQMLVPASSGGPRATQSTHRNYYLDPHSKNIPLVNGTSPYVTNSARITPYNTLDSHTESNRVNRFMDAATLSVTNYGTASLVTRTTAMLDESLFIVTDDIRGSVAAAHEVAWHVLGTRAVVTDTTARQHVQWTTNSVVLDLHVTATDNLNLDLTNGYYVSAWGEENEHVIQCIESRISSVASSIFLTLAHPRMSGSTGLTVTAIGSNGVAAAIAVDSNAGSTNWIVAAVPGTLQPAGPVQSDARLSVVREKGTVTGFSLVEGRQLRKSAQGLFSASRAVSVALTSLTNGFVAELNADAAGSGTYTFAGLPAIATNHDYRAWFNGTAIPTNKILSAGSSVTLTNISGTGTILLTCQIRATDTDGDGLPDDWETQYFGGPTNAVRDADNDVDDYSNWAEWLTGTDPWDSNSVFRVIDNNMASTNLMVFTWPSTNDRVYTVSWSTNLPTGSNGWFLLEDNIPASPPLNSYTVNTASSRFRFFRVKARK